MCYRIYRDITKRAASPIAFVGRRQKTLFCPLLLPEASRGAELNMREHTHMRMMRYPFPSSLAASASTRPHHRHTLRHA